MDYERFGRLNSKKIEELKKEIKKKSKDDSKLYDMSKFFPYLTTRKKSMDQRHTISSFKTMIKKYRYAYSLFDNCKALIKIKGLKDETECIEIDNKVYVFTDISPFDFEYDHKDFEILYDRDEFIPIQSDEGSTFNDMTTSTLQNMQDRKLSPRQYELLIGYLSPIHFISLKNDYIKRNDLDEAVFNEFVWRMVLYGKSIYKESEIKEADIKRKKSNRSRVEDAHTLFNGFNRYGSLEYLHAFSKKLDDAMSYNQKVTANKLFYEFLEENNNTFLLDEFTGNQLLSDALSIYEHNITYLQALKENYAFLTNHYSKGYRHYFSNIHILYISLFKTQQVMRKLKNEYHSIDDMLNSLRKERDKTETSMKVLQEVIENYKEDLGKNKLPNSGCGFVGDGLSDDDGKGGLMDEIREEGSVRLQLEKMERERREKERKLDYLSDEEYLEIQVNEICPLEFFENYEDAYFDYHGSIPIKDVLQIKKLVVTDDVSIEGEFSSIEEMSNWLEEHCGVFRNEEGNMI